MRKSILYSLCVCSTLTPTVASSTTVWSTDLFDPSFGSLWTLYVVTNEDALTIGMKATGVYIDAHGDGQINPNDLLSITPPIVARDSFGFADVWTVDDSIITFNASSNTEWSLEAMIIEQHAFFYI